jgi:hypothetical protein
MQCYQETKRDANVQKLKGIYLGARVLDQDQKAGCVRTTEALLGSSKRSREPRTRDLLFQIIFQPTSVSAEAWRGFAFFAGQRPTPYRLDSLIAFACLLSSSPRPRVVS